jgi:uncharacterized protein (TIGR03435 family)
MLDPRLAFLFAILSTLLHSQPTADFTAFEVASVKPSAPASMERSMMDGGPGTRDPTRFTGQYISLNSLIAMAYKVRPWELSTPGWLRTEMFDIAVTIPEGATREQFELMMQNLLAERFKLKFHREPREMPIYELVVAKGGPKLKESTNGPEPLPPLKDRPGLDHRSWMPMVILNSPPADRACG